jgi:hypothetical protein
MGDICRAAQSRLLNLLDERGCAALYCDGRISLPKWRNGIRGGLKNRCPRGLVGSNPTFGTVDVYTLLRTAMSVV